ncbi:MAG: hypothetical protein SFY80_04055 [Verrucomicrobiota bacterium]|nr:hypothetical protein [Verrucomicrobiota bacterium]
MNKEQIYTALELALETELKAAYSAWKDAASYATDSESKAASQWDTQGLEASYLAAGQAAQVRQLTEALALLRSIRKPLISAHSTLEPGALLHCRMGNYTECFFLAPMGGGMTLEVEGKEITVLTPQTPLAQSLAGVSVGQRFTLANGMSGVLVAVE